MGPQRCHCAQHYYMNIKYQTSASSSPNTSYTQWPRMIFLSLQSC